MDKKKRFRGEMGEGQDVHNSPKVSVLLVPVKSSLFSCPIDFLGGFYESFLDILGSLCGGFHEKKIVLLRKLLSLLLCDCSLVFEVTFVSYQHNRQILV